MSALALVGALLSFRAQASPACLDALLNSYPLNAEIFTEAVIYPKPLLAVGAQPEEILARLAAAGEGQALLQALNELGIRRVRLGEKFRISGWREKTLTVATPSFSTPEQEQMSRLQLARTLFFEKQRQLRWRVNPVSYIDETTAFVKLLERFSLGLAFRNNTGLLKYSLKALIGMRPKGVAGWPQTRQQAGFQFAITRLVAAFYMSLALTMASHLPAAYHTLSTIYELRVEFYEIGEQLKGEGIKIDGRATRLEIIERYQAKIEKLEQEMLSAEPATASEIQAKIDRLKAVIESLRAELKQS